MFVEDETHSEAVRLLDHVHGHYGQLVAWAPQDEERYQDYLTACHTLQSKFTAEQIKKYAKKEHSRLYWHWHYKPCDKDLRERSGAELRCLQHMEEHGAPPTLVKIYDDCDLTLETSSASRWHWGVSNTWEPMRGQESMSDREYIHGVIPAAWQAKPIHDLARSILWQVPKGFYELKGQALEEIAKNRKMFHLVRQWYKHHKNDIISYLSEDNFQHLVELSEEQQSIQFR